MIITCGGIKGGSGKTTVSSNIAVMLAIHGFQVLYVDADQQQTAVDFSAVREEAGVEPKITTIALNHTAVRSEVGKMQGHYDHVVIDTGGRDTSSQRAAMAISDILLVPYVPGSFDIWTAEKLDELVAEALDFNGNLAAYSFLNRADHQGSDNADAAEMLSTMTSVKFWPEVRLGARKAFRAAGGKGLSVIEWKGDNRKGDEKAEAEMKALFGAVLAAGGLPVSTTEAA